MKRAHFTSPLHAGFPPPSLRAKRSNRSRRGEERMDCFATLAMTRRYSATLRCHFPRIRESGTPRLLNSIIDVSGILGPPPEPVIGRPFGRPGGGDDIGNGFAFSRRVAPEVCWILFALDGQRAQGRPGARCTRGLVCNVHKECAHEHTGPAESIRPSLRNGFTAYSVLSPENGSFASVAP